MWLGWIHVTWIGNYFELSHRPIRVMLIVLMLPSLIASASIPSAFDGRDLAFAGGFIATMVVSTVWVWIAVGSDHPLRVVFQRVGIWWTALAPVGVLGALLNGDAQLVLWLVTLALAYFVLWAGFPLPLLGHSHSTDYPISGGHMAQRCLLFVTIALGESILITGSDFGDLPSSFARVVAFVVAFMGAVAIWWIYFDRHAEAAAEVIARSDDPGLLGLIAYTYAHIPIIAGIIVFAAGNEIAIANPRDEVSTAQSLLILGGPALFLAGTWLFKLAVWRHVSISRTLGLVALALLSPMAMMTSSLAMLGAATTVLIGVAGYDLVTEWRLNRVATTEIRGSPSLSVSDTTEA